MNLEHSETDDEIDIPSRSHSSTVNRQTFSNQKGKATKKELLKLLDLEFQRVIPPPYMASTKFLRLVLAGKKSLLKKEDLIVRMQKIK